MKKDVYLQGMYEELCEMCDDAPEKEAAKKAFDDASAWLLREAPIEEVTLGLDYGELWMVIRLEGDNTILCPSYRWKKKHEQGGFIELSDIVGKTIPETWVADTEPEIEVMSYETLHLTYEPPVELASRNADGIVIHPFFAPFSPSEYTSEQLQWLEYIHPQALNAMKRPDLPSTTWTPSILLVLNHGLYSYYWNRDPPEVGSIELEPPKYFNK